MSKIRIDTNGILDLKEIVTSINSQAESAQSYISQARNGIDMNTASSENVSYRINRLLSRIQSQQTKLRQYESALISVNERFLASDRTIANQARTVNYLLNRVIASPYNTSRESLSITAKTTEATKLVGAFSKEGDGVKDYLWNALKKAGHIGAFVSMVSDFESYAEARNPRDYPKGAIKVAKSTKSFVSNLFDDIRKMTKAKRIMHPSTYKASWAKRIFGTTDYLKKVGGASKSAKFSTRWYNNFQKAKGKEFSKVTWAGIALDGVFNAMDNYDEYQRGEISGVRAVAETITETGIDVTVNGLLTAAVAATLGATVGAPVLAVAAGTLAAKTALDGFAKCVTGGEKDFTEGASDLVLNFGKAIADGTIADGISKGVQQIGQDISSAVNKINARWKGFTAGDKIAPVGLSRAGTSTAKWAASAFSS